MDEVGTGMFSDPDEVEEEQSVPEPVEEEEEEYGTFSPVSEISRRRCARD